MNFKKIISIVAVAFISGLLIFGLIVSQQIFSDNTKFSESQVYVHIPTGASYEDVKKIITPLIKDISHFEIVA